MSNPPSQDPNSRSLHLGRLFPNMMTIFGLGAGLTAMRYALDERWELSVSLILIAAVIDGLDGRIARMLNATSDFGAQLDSLADFLSFGVAPAFVLYLWSGHDIRAVGWAAALFFAICCAIRLARFNADIDAADDDTPEQDRYFVGLPAPAGGVIALLPLMLGFAFKEDQPEVFTQIRFTETPIFICTYMTCMALLMASRIPTFSLKKIVIRRRYASLILVASGGCVILLLLHPWLMLTILSVIVLLSVPVSATLSSRR